MSVLRRTQMYLPDDVLTELRRRADRDKTTIARIVRDAVMAFLSKEKARNWEDDALWNMVGAGCSKDGDLSVDHDKYLYGKK